ncbi:transposable element Tc1 transposase [Trichonephila clavipes]|uniref:Transposable element Tc1 transposase n=1 Tax=Trichonephila clavipes TaxID=2585209 RepID=A0A8X6SLH2_TRICX|nr:transposable element Tc1 transposase [Trichonephila clavipes]
MENVSSNCKKLFLDIILPRTQKQNTAGKIIRHERWVLRIPQAEHSHGYLKNTDGSGVWTYSTVIQGGVSQQDNGHSHTTIVTQCAVQSVGMLSWSARSPDWSPIEQEDHEDRGSKDRRIVRQTLEDPAVTRSTIRANVGVAIVPQTISRHLAEANLKSKRPFQALPLTPEHRQLRLQWCQARSMWNVTDWQNVVFIDESR